MPVLYHSPSFSDGGQKVFLATPSMAGPKALYTHSLGQTMREGKFEHALYLGDCHVDDARNVLVAKFLETDCTDLLFIDDDIGWKPRDALQLCAYNADVVAATYPFKQEDEGYPMALLGGDARSVGGLLEVAAVPTGFLRIRRHVLETLAKDAVKFRPKPDSLKELPLIFERQVHGGVRRGGDFAFCFKWRQAGGKIHVDPEICLDHAGEKRWSGSWGHWRRCEMYGAVTAGLMEIQQGAECSRTAIDMVKGWGNHWSGDGTMIDAAVLLARKAKGDILEFGSGLSTLAMAAANPGITIHAVEHSPEWVKIVSDAARAHGLTNIEIHESEVVDWFYADYPRGSYDMVLCDGPPRQIGHRQKVFTEAIDCNVLLMDDLDCPVVSRLFYEWSEANGRQAVIAGRVGVSRKAA